MLLRQTEAATAAQAAAATESSSIINIYYRPIAPIRTYCSSGYCRPPSPEYSVQITAENTTRVCGSEVSAISLMEKPSETESRETIHFSNKILYVIIGAQISSVSHHITVHLLYFRKCVEKTPSK
jgi:hypothetical protein